MKKKKVRKEQIWKEPKYSVLINNGLDIDLVFYVREIYKATFTIAPKGLEKEFKSFVNHVKHVVNNLTRTDMISKVATKKLLKQFGCNSIEDCGNLNHKYNRFITKKFYKAVTKSIYDIQLKSDRTANRKIVGLEKQAERRVQLVEIPFTSADGYLIPVTWNEKKFFKPVNNKQIKKGDWIVYDRYYPLKPVKIFSNKKEAELAYFKKIENLKKYLRSADLLNESVAINEPIAYDETKTKKDLKNDFKLKKIQYSYKINEESRRQVEANLYEALSYLTKVLHTRKNKILFNGKLGFTFEKDVPKWACAICIPEKKLIGLNIVNGAGNLAHEWAHFLDSELGNYFKVDYLSENSEHLKQMNDLMSAIKFKPDGRETRFYKESLREDNQEKIRIKDNSAYWSSDVEMFARAFAMYVCDNLGIDCEFLVRKRETSIIEPRFTTDEKQRVYKCFDKLITKTKKLGIL